MLRFSNGVRLNVKQTTFQKGQISVAVSVANGRLDMPKDKIGPMWASQVVMNGGAEVAEPCGYEQGGQRCAGVRHVPDHRLRTPVPRLDPAG